VSRQSILKWGNSLGFRLPAQIAKQMKVCEGTEVTYRLDGERLIVEAVEQLPSFTVADLERAVRKGKRSEDPFGKPMGREVW
jgi:antitoxin component of MazEF toxin-antitoxin module